MARVCELIGLSKAMHHNRIIEFNRNAKLQGNLDSRDVLKILSTQLMPVIYCPNRTLETESLTRIVFITNTCTSNGHIMTNKLKIVQNLYTMSMCSSIYNPVQKYRTL